MALPDEIGRFASNPENRKVGVPGNVSPAGLLHLFQMRFGCSSIPITTGFIAAKYTNYILIFYDSGLYPVMVKFINNPGK